MATAIVVIGPRQIGKPTNHGLLQKSVGIWQCCLKYFQKVFQLLITKYILKIYFN